MPGPLVDIHPHIISADQQKYPHAPLGGVRSEWSKARAAPWEQFRAAMDEAGVDQAAVVQSSTTYGHDNSYLADSVDSAPDRITGVCSIGLMDDDVLDRIHQWIDERGLSGVRAFTTGSTLTQTDWLDDRKIDPVWERLTEMGLPICIQLRQPALPRLYTVMDRHPNLTVVLDHVVMIDFDAGPPYAMGEPVYPLAKYSGMNLKLTTRALRSAEPSRGGPAGLVRELISHFGSDRIAWGSNWPASEGDLPAMVALLGSALAGLPDRDVENIRSRTALRLYPRLAR